MEKKQVPSPYLSVVVPAYNEEKRIAPTLSSMYEYLRSQPFTWEILIVLDGVEDDTLAVVTEFAQGKEQIRWINRQENRGKGYTVRQGMLAAQGAVRLFMDADNSTHISHFDLMKPLLDEGYQVVIGSRDAKDVFGAAQTLSQPFLKRVLGDAGNLIIQLMVVPGIWDTQCGFKAFTAVAADRIFAVAQSNGWIFDVELLALARRWGYQIGLIPVQWVDDADTHVNRLDYLKSLAETVKIRWRLMTGFYKPPLRSDEVEQGPDLK